MIRCSFDTSVTVVQHIFPASFITRLHAICYHGCKAHAEEMTLQRVQPPAYNRSVFTDLIQEDQPCMIL